MSELKVIDLGNIRESIEKGESVYYEYYAKSEVDKVIAEKDKEIAELKEQIEVLKNQACKMNCMMVKHYNEVCDDNIHQKHKRCLAMAELCRAKRNEIIARTPTLILNHPTEYLTRWENRWLALAEQFKEAK